jgi:hypothetical protein
MMSRVSPAARMQVAESEDGARLRESWANVVNKATPQLRQLAEYYFTRTANGAILATILKLDVSQAMDALAASDGARYGWGGVGASTTSHAHRRWGGREACAGQTHECCGAMLTSGCHSHSVCPSLWCRYRKTIVSHEPHCEITEKGKTVYSEQARAQPYLDEMASTGVQLAPSLASFFVEWFCGPFDAYIIYIHCFFCKTVENQNVRNVSSSSYCFSPLFTTARVLDFLRILPCYQAVMPRQPSCWKPRRRCPR